MALTIFQEIDIAVEGDTFYQAVEKSKNNWATMDTELNAARGGEASLDARLDNHEADTSTHGTTGAIVGTSDSQTLTNKTLTTPTIGDLTNATHDHADAAGGGTIDKLSEGDSSIEVIDTGTGSIVSDIDNLRWLDVASGVTKIGLLGVGESANINIHTRSADFHVIDLDNTGQTSFIFRDHSAGKLYLGTNNDDAVVVRSSTLTLPAGTVAVTEDSATRPNIVGGTGAGDSITSGEANLCLGRNAGTGITTSNENTIVGVDAGQAAYNYAGSSIFGEAAGYLNQQGGISFFGASAGYNNTTGSSNSYFGYTAGIWNITGTDNSYFGNVAGGGTETNSHSNNSAFGSLSLTGVTTGGGNSCFGRKTGDNITSGSNNLIVGHDIDPASATADNQFMMGNATYPFLKGEMNNYILAINGANGYLNFNTTLGTSGYGVRDNAGVMEFKDSGGSWITFASLVN